MATETMNIVCNAIVEVCGIERARLLPSANAVDELGIDSVDFLDIIYEVQKQLSIKVPAEDWMEEINSGRATTADYFVLSRFVEHIDRIAGQKTALAG